LAGYALPLARGRARSWGAVAAAAEAAAAAAGEAAGDEEEDAEVKGGGRRTDPDGHNLSATCARRRSTPPTYDKVVPL